MVTAGGYEQMNLFNEAEQAADQKEAELEKEEIPSLSERSIRPVIRMTNKPKAVLREKQDSKREKIFSIKFIIIVW